MDSKIITFYEFIKMFFDDEINGDDFHFFDVEMLDKKLIDNKVIYNSFNYKNANQFYDNIKKINIFLKPNLEFGLILDFKKDSCKMDNIKSFKFTNLNLLNLPNFSNNMCCKYLQCVSCNLTKLELLPPLLKKLNCRYNKIEIINNFLSEIKELRCDYNYLTNLNFIVFPQLIIDLNCNHNKITELPSNLINCEQLRCGHNLISKLPENLNKKLKFLYWDN